MYVVANAQRVSSAAETVVGPGDDVSGRGSWNCDCVADPRDARVGERETDHSNSIGPCQGGDRVNL